MHLKKTTTILLVFLLSFASFAMAPVFALEGSKNIELTFVNGDNELDLSDFSEDLLNAVYEQYGITGDRIRITKAGAVMVDSQNQFDWNIYDHYYASDYPTNGSEPTDWSVYHPSNQPYFYYKEQDPADSSKYFTDVSPDDESMQNCYYRSKHIYPKDDGLYFLGYSVPAYKDFMLYPDDNIGEKTIKFAITEGAVDTHTLEGAGFLFNTSIVDNKLNGYLILYDYQDTTYESGVSYPTVKLYKFKDVVADQFHNEVGATINDLKTSNLAIPGISLIATKDSLTTDETKNIKVVVTKDSLKFYENEATIFDTTYADADVIIEDTGAGGFGPLVSYENHYCSDLSYFIFKDLTMETYKPLTFLELINQLSWDDGTERFIVNVDDDGVPEFSNSEALNTILSKMRSNKVHYIGWGRNNLISGVEADVYNEDQAKDFITANNGRGIFINQEDEGYSTFEQGIDAIAKYINDVLIKPEDDKPGHGHYSGGTISPPTFIFPDMTNHWAKNEASRLALLKLINGYPDGNFAPEKIVTRAEFAAMLDRVFTYAKIAPNSANQVNFSDVTSGRWYYDVINRLAPEGIILGYGDGTFRPNNPVTREEAAAMIARLVSRLNIELQNSEITFSDKDKISSWAVAPVGRVLFLGIIEGLPDGSFHPADNSTRAQAAVMILRMLEKTKLI